MTDQPKLTAEKRVARLADLKRINRECTNCDPGSICLPCTITAIRQAEDAVRDAWMRATEHNPQCSYVNGPKTPCGCGAHARLAQLHAEAAKAIREGHLSLPS